LRCDVRDWYKHYIGLYLTVKLSVGPNFRKDDGSGTRQRVDCGMSDQRNTVALVMYTLTCVVSIIINHDSEFRSPAASLKQS